MILNLCGYLSTDNIGFYVEILKVIPELSSDVIGLLLH